MGRKKRDEPTLGQDQPLLNTRDTRRRRPNINHTSRRDSSTESHAEGFLLVHHSVSEERGKRGEETDLL